MIVVSEIFLPLHTIKLTNNSITKFTFFQYFFPFLFGGLELSLYLCLLNKQ